MKFSDFKEQLNLNYEVDGNDFLQFFFSTSTANQQANGINRFFVFKFVENADDRCYNAKKIAEELNLSEESVRMILHNITCKKNNIKKP